MTWRAYVTAVPDFTGCAIQHRSRSSNRSRLYAVSAALAWPADRRRVGGISPATVSRILKRLGFNRIGALEPVAPVCRYERDKLGEMIHLDIKKLGRFNRIGHRITGDRKGQSNSRGVSWEFVHVAIDDHSRIAFAKIMSSERRRCAASSLKTPVAYYQSLGIRVERVLIDNGFCYKAFAFPQAL